MIKPIITEKKVLHTVCEPAVDPIETAMIINDLENTAANLKNKTGYGCAGLAAPQIGYTQRIILVNVQSKSVIMVNPEIILTKGKCSYGNESCFSVPASFTRPRRIKRWFKIKVRYEDEWGEIVENHYRNLDARIIQHEIDHLDGKLISD